MIINGKAFAYRIPFVAPSVAREDDDKPDEKFVKQFNALFHSAMSERDKRDAPKRKKELDDAFAAFATAQGETLKSALADALKGFKPEPDPGGDDPKGGKGKGGAGGDPETRAQLAKMQKAIDDANTERENLKKSIEAERTKVTEAENKSRRQEEMQIVTSLLTESKVRPNLLRMAAEDIHKRFIAREKFEDGTFGEVRWKDGDELVDPKDPKRGLSKFLSTDEGKDLLPAANAGGAGSVRPQGGQGGQRGEVGFEQLGAHIMGRR